MVWLRRRNAMNRIRGAGASDGTFIAVNAAVMPDLEMERAIAEHRATFHTFTATDAERFVNRVFVIWVFDKLPFDCAGGAELIFSGGIELVRLWFEVTGAKLAVTAHIKTVNAFHG